MYPQPLDETEKCMEQGAGAILVSTHDILNSKPFIACGV